MSSRRTLRRLSTLGLVALALLVVGPGLQAQDRQLVSDSSGTVYRLLQGTYGKLFPDGTATGRESPVLALDVVPAGGEAERWIVPGTESFDPESSASLVYEKRSGVVYLLWQSWLNGLHPRFQLASFDGSVWSEVVEIAYGPFIRKGSPRLTVTRETVAEGEERTLLQLIWWEAAPGATSRKRYAPIFVDGASEPGSPPVIDLSSFLSHVEPAAAPLPDVAGLENALALRPGINARSAVLGFLDPDTHRLVTLQVELLPRALDELADRVRAHIVIVGNNSIARNELAQSARDEILENAEGFHVAARRHLADEVFNAIASSTDDEVLTAEDVAALADRTRAHIVIVGSYFRGGGLEDTNVSEILEIPAADGGSHHLDVSVISERAAPEVGGRAELLLSESGRNVIVTWEQDGFVHYRESAGEGWSEPGAIELTAELDRATVYRMLSERVRTD